MSRHFSPPLLYTLRNHIPIGILIERVLAIPTKRIGGYLRFNCPICGGFQTAVHPKENLARCFHCRKNFNPIDMVMCCQKMGFVESVGFLKQLDFTESKRSKESPCGHGGRTGALSPRSLRKSPRLPDPDATNRTVHSLGQILSESAPINRSSSPSEEKITYYRNLLRRIEILEQKMAMLLNLSSSG